MSVIQPALTHTSFPIHPSLGGPGRYLHLLPLSPNRCFRSLHKDLSPGEPSLTTLHVVAQPLATAALYSPYLSLYPLVPL